MILPEPGPDPQPPGSLVHATADQRVEGVRDRGDPAGQRNLLAAQALEVPGAIPALVVRFCHVRGELEQRLHGARQDRVPERDVLLDHVELGRGDRARFEQDPVREPHLADVVHG
jgi:hypothetical protein